MCRPELRESDVEAGVGAAVPGHRRADEEDLLLDGLPRTRPVHTEAVDTDGGLPGVRDDVHGPAVDGEVLRRGVPDEGEPSEEGDVMTKRYTGEELERMLARAADPNDPVHLMDGAFVYWSVEDPEDGPAGLLGVVGEPADD